MSRSHGVRIHLATPDLPEADPRRTYVEFTLEPDGDGTVLHLVETGFAQLPVDTRPETYDSHVRAGRAERQSWRSTSMAPDIERRGAVVLGLADPHRRAILATLAAQGPAAGHKSPTAYPITRQQ